MSKFTKCKIYRVIADDSDLVYIGGTTQKLCRRLANHKSVRKKYLNHYDELKNYVATAEEQKLFQILSCTKPKIYLIEDFPCERKEQLDSRVEYYRNKKM